MAAGTYVPQAPGKPAGSPSGGKGKGKGAPSPAPTGANNMQVPGKNGPWQPGKGIGSVGGGKGGGKGSGTGTGYDSPLYDPTQTLTGKPLAQAATAIADAQTTGPISELAAQIAQQNRQGAAAQRETLGYYLQLAQAAKDAVGRDQAIGTGLNTALQGVSDQTQGQLTQLGQGATGGALSRMQALGLDAGQTQALNNETARQQGIGDLNAQTFKSAGLSQNANYAENANNNRGIAALAGTEGITKLAQGTRFANEPLNQKIAALIQSKGALTATALGQLRTAERNYQIAEQGLGTKNAALKLTAAQDLARNAIANRSITSANNRSAAAIAGENFRNAASITGANSRSAAAIAARKAIADAKKTAATGKPLPRSEQNTLYGQMDTIGALIQDVRDHGFPAVAATATSKALPAIPHPSQAQIIQVLQSGQNPRGVAYARYLIDAVFELRQNGYITQATAAALRSHGLRGGNFNGKPIKVGPGSVPTQIPGVGYIPGI